MTSVCKLSWLVCSAPVVGAGGQQSGMLVQQRAHRKLIEVLPNVRQVLLAAAGIHDEVHLRGRHLCSAYKTDMLLKIHKQVL